MAWLRHRSQAVAAFSCFASCFAFFLRTIPTFLFLWPWRKQPLQRCTATRMGTTDTPGWTETDEPQSGVLEVEQKFRCTEALLQRLEAISEVRCQKDYTDVYFDTADCSLTVKDIWLRSRNEQLELKVPHSVRDTSVSLYMEVSKHQEIAVVLASHTEIRLPLDRELSSRHLIEVGLRPFAKIATCRTRYNIQMDAQQNTWHQDVTVFVDIDQVSFLEESTGAQHGDYIIGEVELDAESVKTLSTTQKVQLMRHALSTLNITATSPPHGKVEEFLRRHRPMHFEKLQVLGT